MGGLNLHVSYQNMVSNYNLQGSLRFSCTHNSPVEVTAFTQPTIPSVLKVADDFPAEAIFCSQYFFKNGQSVTVEMLPFTLDHPLKVQGDHARDQFAGNGRRRRQVPQRLFESDLVDGFLDLVDDHVGELGSLFAVETFHRRHHPDHQQRDQRIRPTYSTVP